MNEDIVYLTFPTDKKTAHLLTKLAHIYGKTQPELINELCQDHIKQTMEFMLSKIENNKPNS